MLSYSKSEVIRVPCGFGGFIQFKGDRPDASGSRIGGPMQ